MKQNNIKASNSFLEIICRISQTCKRYYKSNGDCDNCPIKNECKELSELLDDLNFDVIYLYPIYWDINCIENMWIICKDSFIKDDWLNRD